MMKPQITQMTQIKEHPILFSGAMVRAILDGSKTMTRRVCRKPIQVRLFGRVNGDFPFHRITAAPGTYEAILNPQGAVSVKSDSGEELGIKPAEFEWACPYGRVGDRLWVRETWKLNAVGGTANYVAIKYAADNTISKPFEGKRDQFPYNVHFKKRPSIHMPRWASRISLEVVGVRVERLTCIAFYDIRKEGISCPLHDFDGGFCASECQGLRNAFAALWDSINGKRGFGWEVNPWVWVIEFKRIENRTSSIENETGGEA